MSVISFSQPVQIPNQGTDVPALVQYANAIFMVYSDSDGSGTLWSSWSLDGVNWRGAIQIPGQTGFIPALAVWGNYLYMVYSDSNSAQLWVTRTHNCVDWIDTQQIPNQATSTPALVAFPGIGLCLVYSDSSSSQLWCSVCANPPASSGQADAEFRFASPAV